MKKIVTCLLVSILVVSMMGGCSSLPSKGRFSAIDIDLRTAEQTIAYQNEADIVYIPDSCVSNAISASNSSAPKVLTVPWDMIIKLVEVVKGRIRIFTIEWRNDSNK